MRMNWPLVMTFCFLYLTFLLHCSGFPLPQEIGQSNGKEARANGDSSNGITSAMSGFQSGLSSVLNNSNMKEAKLVMGGFSFVIVPSPDMAQISQMNPSQFAQLPSLPGRK